eukprot:Protomagalhaensia_sp_Gyna_25__1338@NODE_1672_length_1635_cov_5056_439223_g1369_i0_p1_GENE_NODE_1672_length_1635_cov_5056_439223_g1369_i0NODE_1672_length_1635_cov_5056_439223_g1369_i0_p1_ORF_typecomplete_len494_score125_99Lyase_1/PF00206_20/1_8e90FumaraseC_C/PF10415_9/6_4e03FumaraseC_C/PF10415_9/3_7e20_NODE_1672_length_1635_cov_5056_439223_g1369_i01531550
MAQPQYREDSDSLGKVQVPIDAKYGAQTQRSIGNFPFGENERQPMEVVTALAIVKEAAAISNKNAGKLPKDIADAVINAAKEVREGKHPEAFPLVIWQTGSGTQSNMNMNEVIANLANVALGGQLGQKAPVHPNDHVNKGMSSNDVFPSAMHIATAIGLEKQLKPALKSFIAGLEEKVKAWDNITKIGRTHLMDAVPMTLGQEFSAFAATLELCLKHIESTEPFVRQLALGGTAVGTGLNSYKGFDVEVAAEVSKITAMPFETCPNKFMSLSMTTPMVAVSGALTALATTLLKMANDVRLLASGPRAGLGELILPSNEPGSSIMPGKVNPTQCESMAMVCTQIIGNHTTVCVANTDAHLQLNVYLPVTTSNVLRSIRLLSTAMDNFRVRCLAGMEPNMDAITDFVTKSLMLVTALTPKIGYDMAAKVALNAHNKGSTLKESALELKALTEEEFDAAVKPELMTRL